MTSETQKRQADLRRKRWNKAEKPYFKTCLTCSLSCTMTVKYAGAGYDIFSCPKKDRGEPAYPYKWIEMLKEHDQKEKERKRYLEQTMQSKKIEARKRNKERQQDDEMH